MPSPKSGSAGSAVSPAEPKKAEEADKADPGEVEKIKAEQRQTQTGKYGSIQVAPYKASAPKGEKQEKQSWIEIELADALGNPVPGALYDLTLPDGSMASGSLDEKGFVRVEGIPSGTCQITFPAYDGRSWEKT